MKGDRYDRPRGDLPWGWWLRANGGRLEDPDGGSWSDVRTAFWEGRLGFRSDHLAVEQLELLLRVLAAIKAQWFAPAENGHDLFGGDMMLWRFYLCWLQSVGLVANPAERSPTPFSAPALSAPLSDEGRAVLLMLEATREPAWVDLPLAAVVDTVRRAGRDRPTRRGRARCGRSSPVSGRARTTSAASARGARIS